MRRTAEDFPGQGLELIYIARRLGEAKHVEELLDAHGLDYTVEVEHYRAGIIFVTLRAGAFFYVPPETAAGSRDLLRESGYEPQV